MTDRDETSGPLPVSERVERTGLAVVHEGDRIIPGRGSAAVLGPLAPAVVNYYFPVEIEVVGARDIAERIYDALRQQLEALG